MLAPHPRAAALPDTQRTRSAASGEPLHAGGGREQGVHIRPYMATDRESVRRICCDTAFRNLGAAAMVDDPELFGDYWSSYYTDHEPETCLVAVVDGHVAGYLLGTTDAGRYARVMGRSIVPRVVARLAWRLARGRYRGQPRAVPFVRWLASRSWREAPAVDRTRFPAHYHVNLTTDAYEHGLYSALALRFLDRCAALGQTHLHGQVLDYAERGVWQRFASHFMREHPYVVMEFAERATTLGRNVLGIARPLVNRSWGTDIASYRLFLHWLHDRYGL